MSKDLPSVIDSLLKKVRDAGAVDDNNGGEDWTLSDVIIAKTAAQILKHYNQDLIQARQNEIALTCLGGVGGVTPKQLDYFNNRLDELQSQLTKEGEA